MSPAYSSALVTLLAAQLVDALHRPGDHSGPVQARAIRIATVDGFGVPESARFDTDRDLYYVSNVTGHPTARDNSGFISLMDPDGRVTTRQFILGGRDGTTLHAPKGMALVGDTLWVADIDHLRGFHRRTGAAVATIDLRAVGAAFLNDITVGPDGSLYLSDTGFRPDSLGRLRPSKVNRIFRVRRPAAVDVAIESDSLRAPNGVLWDSIGRQLLIGDFDGNAIRAWRPGEGLRVLARGPGSYDGLESLADGTILVASQEGRGIFAVSGETMRPLISGVEDVGDIGVDRRRRRIAIPRLDTNLLELWQLQ